jgi:isopentenyl-diphosphate delta-isomerase
VEDCDFETYIHERLLDEMGFDCELEFKFAFHYRVEFENGLCENEIDHVYFGIWNGLPKQNITEVDDFEWISFEHLKSIISDNPDKYTYWFKELISRVQLK